jgi:cytochrome c-type biogenesis protein CcmH
VTRRIGWIVMGVLFVLAFAVGAARSAQPRTNAERVDAIAKTIKCPTCRSESVFESRSAAAENIRNEIARQVAAGRTDAEVKAYVAERFGDDLLLNPPASGIGGLVWVLPVVAVAVGAGALGLAFTRWRTVGASTEVEVGDESVSSPPRRGGRTVAVVAGVAVVAVGAGWLVARSSGERLPGEASSGDVAESINTLLVQARGQQTTDPKAAIDTYEQVLKSDPDNAEALTYRGWMLALVGSEAVQRGVAGGEDLVARAVESFDRAIAAAPSYADPHCFKAITEFRFFGDAAAAKPAIDACMKHDPPQAVAGLVQSLGAEIDAALASPSTTG